MLALVALAALEAYKIGGDRQALLAVDQMNMGLGRVGNCSLDRTFLSIVP